MKSKFFIILCFIFLLAALLRFWKLSEFPVSLSMDEVSTSYDAYSVFKTGRDMYGNFLPLAFRSVGDYKSPVLTYLMIPAITVFGLNEFSTRFTIALVGTLAVIATYFLAKELTNSRVIGLLASFSLSISPWHIQYSRATFDYVLADFFLITGVWTFLKAVRSNGKYLWLSVILLVLSAYSYHAERLMIPIFLLGIGWLWRKELVVDMKNLLIVLFVGLVISLPLVNILLHKEGQARATSVFISQDYLINSGIKSSETENLLGKIIGNKFVLIFNFWIKRYLNYWDLKYLFLDGSKLTQPSLPDVGLFHLFEIIPFLVGSLVVLRPKNRYLGTKEKGLIFLWLALGPLAASLTNNDQHAGRAFSLIPAPQIIVGIGLGSLIQKTRSFRFFSRSITIVSATLITVFSVIYFLDIYFVHFPAQFSEFWGYGRKEAIEFALAHQHEYREIVIDPSYGTQGQTTIDAPYLYALYYSKFDPQLFQIENRRLEWKDSMNFSNFTFRSIYWPKDCALTERLFIGSSWSLPLKDIPQNHILKTIYFKNSNLAFLILENMEKPLSCRAT